MTVLQFTSRNVALQTGGQWLTARRLRAHAVIFAVCLWSLFIWNVATPGLRDRVGNLKGTDFLHFYTLGMVAAEHRGSELYDMNAQAELAWTRVPQAAGLRYLPLYPPQVSILFAPLAQMSYGKALTVWWLSSAILYALCCYPVWRACPSLRRYRSIVILAAIGFPAFFHLIAWGQTSALALVCFTGLFFCLRAEREFLAGLVLGCLVFKPQLGIAAAVLFIGIGAWKVVTGAVLSASAQLLIGALYYGLEPLRHWARTMLALPSLQRWLEPRPYQTHSLRTFWTLLMPWGNVAFAFYVASAAVVLLLLIRLWRQHASLPLGLRYSCLLFATVLVAPHLTVYDLVVLAPALFLVADWIADGRKSAGYLGTLLYLVYALPLVGPTAKWTHLQLSVLAMGAAMFAIWRAGQSEAASVTQHATVLQTKM
jgi:alpha-1,2-mannosyltransferase